MEATAARELCKLSGSDVNGRLTPTHNIQRPALNCLPLLPSYRRRAFPSKFSHQSVLAVLAEGES